MDWIKELRAQLCKLYEKWGGNCADLELEPGDWVGTVVSEYEAKGAPSFANNADKLKFLMDLDELEDLLKSPDNSLTGAENTELLGLIASLRSDLA